MSMLPHSIEENHLRFVNTWMQQHIDDADNLLGMPVLIGEFGVSLKDGRFGNEFREPFMETVYSIFLSSWEGGVIEGGSLLWQLFPEGAECMDDGYAVIFCKITIHIKHTCKSLKEARTLRVCCFPASHVMQAMLQGFSSQELLCRVECSML